MPRWSLVLGTRTKTLRGNDRKGWVCKGSSSVVGVTSVKQTAASPESAQDGVHG